METPNVPDPATATNVTQAAAPVPAAIEPPVASVPTPPTGGVVSSEPIKRHGKFSWFTLSHILPLLAIIVLAGGAGSYFLFASHADTPVVNGRIYATSFSLQPDGTKLLNNEAFATQIHASPYVFSHAGNQVAYIYPKTTNASSGGQSDYTLAVAKSDGTGAQDILTAQQVKSATGLSIEGLSFYNNTFAWSPDGTWIAVAINFIYPSTAPSIGLVHPDGTDFHLVSNLPPAYHPSSVSWLPDSQTLVYLAVSYAANGTPSGQSLCHVQIDGTNSSCANLPSPLSANGTCTTLCNQDNYDTVQVSPNGQNVLMRGISNRVYFSGSSWTNQYDLFTTTIDGQNLHQLTHVPLTTDPAKSESVGYGVWSPDGNQIAYNYNSGGIFPNAAGVYVMNADGTNAKRLTTNNNSVCAWQAQDGAASNPTIPGTTQIVTDLTPPVVSFTSTLSPVLIAPTTIHATATDDTSVAKTEYYLDGTVVASFTGDAQQTSGFKVDPATLSPGTQHTLVAKAYDPAGNIGTSPIYSFAAGYVYNPLATPSRLIDTRTTTPIGAGKTLNVQVNGKGGVPTTGVAAALLNVTIVSSTSNTNLTVYPTGSARPATANLSISAGQIFNTQVTSQLSQAGSVTIYNVAGNANVIVDVLGYYGATGSGYTTVTPTRISDTRAASSYPNAGQTLAANIGTVTVQVPKALNVPAGAVAVVQETVLNEKAGGYLTAYPAGTAKPGVSALNYKAGLTMTREVTVKLNSANAFTLSNTGAGTTDVITDIVGYFAPGSGAAYVPISPVRITDTRANSGKQNSGKHITAGASIPVNAMTGTTIPANAKALNMTLISPNTNTAKTYFVTYPVGATRGGGTVLSMDPALGNFNEVTAALNAQSSFNIFNAAGTADAIVDASGYYY